MSANTNNNVLLAVDVAPGEPMWHFSAAAEMARDMIRDSVDHVVVLHVREFSVGRLVSMMREHGGADGRRAVEEVVVGLRAAGVQANGQIREADVGHVARTILDAAHEFDARVIVLTAARRRVPLGSVARHLLHLTNVPVVIVQRPDVPLAAAPSAADLPPRFQPMGADIRD